ncbi:MAG: hypothetical protein EH225_12580 [Calditrichaeota bacterium]|nr:hypothetical protein [Calditrichota bacterium]RQV98793.1 MAG: hypothetical protein EH225_12580 [Calditrichota bacterium]
MEKIDPQMIFVLNPRQSPEKNNLLHLEWAVVSQVDGQKTVAQIAEDLALNERETEEIFRKLASDQILILLNSSEEERKIPADFFQTLNHEITLVLGPVAGIVLEDVLTMMRMSADNFEKRYLASLIEILTNQIDDQIKQVEFQKNIYSKARKYLLK